VNVPKFANPTLFSPGAGTAVKGLSDKMNPMAGELMRICSLSLREFA